jgi:hypothetical protein
VNSDGRLASVTDITSSPQINIFTIPNVSASRGSWLVNGTSPDGAVKASAAFSVSDPAAPSADLSLNMANPLQVNADTDLVFTVRVANQGPDTAAGVVLTDVTPADTTFVGTAQSGSTFTCVNANGTTTCTAASLAKGAEVLLTLTYHVNSGVVDDTIISNTIDISSTTTELDSGDNTFTATATVDHVACVITCPSNITASTDQDQYYATVSYQTTDNGNCGTGTVSNPPSGSHFPVGTTLVTSGGRDGAACSFSVTVNDTQAPSISCPANVTTTESPAGSGSAVVNYAAPTVTDNDPQAAATCDHPSGSSFPVGDTTVICTATDRAGNSSTACQFTVTVESLGGCTLGCPQDITVNNDAGACGAIVTYPGATSSQDCAAGTVSYSQASGTSFPVGTTTVTATRSTGETCTFHITVVDSEAPQVTCPANVTVNAASGQCDATVNPGTATATDQCAGVTVAGARTDGGSLNGSYHVGATTIVWTATDAAGNTSSCEQTVTVNDTTAPTITCPPNINQGNDPGACSATLDPGTATGTDGCGIESVTGTRSDHEPLDAPYPVGTTTITWVATDQSDNTATCSQTVIINDTESPTVVAPADSSASADANCQAAVPDYITGSTVTDNCTPTVTQSPAAGTLVGTGTTTVTVTATDAAGHSASDTVVFTVNDTTAPTITAPADVTAYTGPGATSCDAVVTLGSPTTSDNCAGVTVTRSPSGNTFGLGDTNVVWTATDAAGNTATATQKVTVIDNTPPVVTPPANIVVTLPANSSATSMAVSYPNPATATDNCAGAITISYSPTSGSTFSVGTTTVTVSATDAHNNTGTATFTVTVLYNFTGFFSPVSNAPTLNSVNAGKAIPVKFSLSGDKGLNIFAANSPTSVSLSCSSSDPGVDVVETVNAGGSSLSYGGGQYNYVWKTESSWAGTCRQLRVTLNDGSVHVANFKFK